MERIKAVIGFLVKGRPHINKILLAIKQKKVACGYWMPYGGKVEPGETFREAMARELLEEARVVADHSEIERIGTLYTVNYFRGRVISAWEVGMYLIHDWTGTPATTREMADPRWFGCSKKELPLRHILPADRTLLAKITRKYIAMEAKYNLEDMSLRRPPEIIWEMNRPKWRS